MTSRRAILTGLGGMTLMAGAYATGAYRAAMAASEARLALRSSVIGTRAGAVEYAIAGRGPPLMMIHGTGGGFDQGLLFAHRLRADGFWAGAPSHTAFDRIAVPTLILSCEDDLFGTAATARLLAQRIRGARLTVFPDGGHIWLGHDADVARETSEFIAGTASTGI